MIHRDLLGSLLVGSLLMGPVTLHAQTQSAWNPEMTFIADMRVLSGDATPDELEFFFNGLEFGAQAYLNPFARGDVFIGYHEGTVELEEAYATFTALPGGFSLRGGQYRMRIDRFNPLHEHSLPWLDYPGLITRFFGDEGYQDAGINPSWLVSLWGVPLTLEADAANGNFHPREHAHGDEGEVATQQDTAGVGEDRPRTLGDLTYSGRATVFFTLGATSWLEVGGSLGTGMLDFDDNLRGTWYGGDFKYRWRPSRRTSFDLAGELLVQEREQPELGITRPLGFFGYVDYRFWRNWNLGGMVDYVEEPESPSLHRVGFGGFAGYSLYEETTVIRFLLRRDELPGDQGHETLVKLQLLFGLGPHKAHSF